MINAQLKLILPVFSAATNAYKILSTTHDSISLPSMELCANQDIQETISTLISRHLSERLDVVPKLIDICMTDVLNVYYICFINYETQIINGSLQTIDLITHEFPANATKILSLLSIQ